MCEESLPDCICIPREEDIALQRVAKAAELFLIDVLDDHIEEMPDDTPAQRAVDPGGEGVEGGGVYGHHLASRGGASVGGSETRPYMAWRRP